MTDLHDEDQQVGWVLIPPSILAAQDLTMGEKVLWGRVNGLTSKRGYCFATNEWLGDQLGYSTRTIETYIASLVEKGYMRREYGSAGKRTRRLFPIPILIGKSPAEESHPDPDREDIPIRVGMYRQ